MAPLEASSGRTPAKRERAELGKEHHKTRWWRRKRWYLMLFVLVYVGVFLYHQYKPLPDGISYASDEYRVDDVKFYRDLTHHEDDTRHVDQEIFARLERMIEEAEDFIVIDAFMMDGRVSDPSENYPPIADDLMRQLITKKSANPDMPIVFISDSVNTGYGSYPADWLEPLKEAGIEVVMSNLHPLRDSTPLYSTLWRMGLQWFGQEGTGWMENPFVDGGPRMTLRSYLKLFNIKANHRKVYITERSALVASANAHTESGFHENVAFEVTGPIIAEMLAAEQAVIDLGDSGVVLPDFEAEEAANEGELRIQYTTEGETLKKVLDTLARAGPGNELWLGMYYLADRQVVNAITDAANRGAQVSMILDPNETAFGRKKSGLPNRPVVEELDENTDGAVRVRWYAVDLEQYHPKMMMLKEEERSTIISGSTNFTKRNLADYNLEAGLTIRGPPEAEVMGEVEAYFDSLWNNRGGAYTLDQDEYQNVLTEWQRVVYAVQTFLNLTSY
ncbi:MAG TPA: phospholipase D family protein [Halomonas sp.]|nr:phospholipase D family protein [Halomonas sp.]